VTHHTIAIHHVEQLRSGEIVGRTMTRIVDQRHIALEYVDVCVDQHDVIRSKVGLHSDPYVIGA